MEIKNAVIKSTFIGREDHGILTCNIQLDYGGSGQGFGGYNLRWWGIDFIQLILDTLEVRSWEELKGTHLRVKADMNHVEGIGHIIKDKWFIPLEAKKQIGENK